MEIVNIIDRNQKIIFDGLNLPFNVNVLDQGIKPFITFTNNGLQSVVKLIPSRLLINSIPISTYSKEIDFVSELIKLIRNEIERFLIKDFVKNFSNSDYIFIPRSKYQLESEKSQLFIRELIYKSIRSQSKNILTSPIISNEISNSFNFNPIVIKNLSGLYKAGVLSGLDLYVDPYINYKDNKILLWNGVNCYLSFGSIYEIVDPTSIVSKISIDFNYHLEVSDPNIIYYLSDEKSEGYNLFVSEMRDEKIDQILDGRK